MPSTASRRDSHRVIGHVHFATAKDVLGQGAYAGHNWMTTVPAGSYPVELRACLSTGRKYLLLRLRGNRDETFVNRIGASTSLRRTQETDVEDSKQLEAYSFARYVLDAETWWGGPATLAPGVEARFIDFVGSDGRPYQTTGLFVDGVCL